MPKPTSLLLLPMSIPLWPHCTLLLTAASSGTTHHVIKLKSAQTVFVNMTTSSLYWNSLHSYQIYRTPLGQIRSNCVMLSCQLGPKSLTNVSQTFLNLWHKESRQFWPFSNTCDYKLWLIKWLLSKHCRRKTSWMKFLQVSIILCIFSLFCGSYSVPRNSLSLCYCNDKYSSCSWHFIPTERPNLRGNLLLVQLSVSVKLWYHTVVTTLWKSCVLFILHHNFIWLDCGLNYIFNIIIIFEFVHW